MSLGAPELATREYWDTRYDGEDRDGYDWFKKYSDIADFLKLHLHYSSRILILGCGTSSLSAELYDAGYKHVTSMDFSPVAIHVMKQQNMGRPEMSFDVMDIRDLHYANETFDIAIDVSSDTIAE
ncbi:protein of unknown function [Taphrina deformans PYCC 5710]|uniref:Methyltransferase domain-containing protein n=1 Tax=Taphrina deformans (strain PYCC 5710 / ATCC 11124 / CBS 356.35 / IMI 108563 / JCM 9778 / NBRC 8474) TaxID=1097556 RepID=R4X8B4_TAPDE|nr:protein of unknown function [Taphrina deformans PYCC 5710]|eukprot:CCG81804.1 protein of unknown function [Taphrina deformans PYCC 5710]